MDKKHNPRNCVLVVKVTATEKEKVTKYAAERSVNVSALVRKLLFQRLEQDA